MAASSLPHTLFRAAAPASLIAIVVVTWFVYAPGLRSTFLLDDVPALMGLETIHTTGDAYRYVLSGTSGPTGRPLSLASFLLDDNSWPSSPYRFKRTNLLIHLLNGVFLAWLGLLLCRVLNENREHLNQAIAVAAMTIWLLHPFNVSTTLYIVQRMAQLSALFTIAGLIAYTHGRTIVAARPKAGYLWMTAGIAFGGALAILCKENGLLIVLFALAIEYLVLRNGGVSAPPRWRLWASVFLYLPMALFLSWVVWRFPAIRDGFQLNDRPYSMTERLLTEARVLFDYLSNILIPVRQGTSVFHDDYVISRSLTQPVSTLLSVAGVLALTLIAFITRRRYPLLSFAIVWFFIGHLMESTIFALEIYFEHRNYLAMYGILLAGVYYCFTIRGSLSRFLKSAAVVFGVLVTLMTARAANLWSNPLLCASMWALEHPASFRAQQNAAAVWMRYGHLDKTEEYLRKVADIKPEAPSPWLQLATINCLQGKDINETEMQALISKMSEASYETVAARSIELLFDNQRNKRCTKISAQQSLQLLQALQSNPRYQERGRTTANLYVVESMIQQYLKDHRNAARALAIAFEHNPLMDYALLESRFWAAVGELGRSKDALSRAKNANRYSIAGISIDSKALNRWESFLDRQLAQHE